MTISQSCHMSAPHDAHPWDTEERTPLRNRCPGIPGAKSNHARNGRAREHRVSKRMQAAGWLQIMRAAGSKGPADLAMLHPFHGLAWVQVGTAASKTLGPADRDRLCAVAEQTHALALLAACAPGLAPRFYVVTRETASKWKEWDL